MSHFNTKNANRPTLSPFRWDADSTFTCNLEAMYAGLAMERGQTTYESCSINFRVKDSWHVSDREMSAFFATQGMALGHAILGVPTVADMSTDLVFFSSERTSAISVDRRIERERDCIIHLRLYSVTDDVSELVGICQRFKEAFASDDQGEDAEDEANVSVLIRNSRGLHLHSLQTKACPFQPQNYTEKNAAGFFRIVQGLSTPNPNGTFFLLAGPPGTGKTYFIRALMQKAASEFLLVPANLITSISSPEITSVLLERRTNVEKPLTLILEDADQCLVSRSESMSEISSLLNLCDGILGNLLDVRIIATTNADIKDIDEALDRDGRHHTSLTFDLLKPGHATRLYSQLSSVPKDFTEPVALATVYKEAGGTKKIGHHDAQKPWEDLDTPKARYIREKFQLHKPARQPEQGDGANTDFEYSFARNEKRKIGF